MEEEPHAFRTYVDLSVKFRRAVVDGDKKAQRLIGPILDGIDEIYPEVRQHFTAVYGTRAP